MRTRIDQPPTGRLLLRRRVSQVQGVLGQLPPCEAAPSSAPSAPSPPHPANSHTVPHAKHLVEAAHPKGVTRTVTEYKSGEQYRDVRSTPLRTLTLTVAVVVLIPAFDARTYGSTPVSRKVLR